MCPVVLSRRALNRATLARQLLLEPSDRSAFDAIEHLVGMQAQVPLNPHLGLWSRLEGFVPEDLASLLWARRVVRTVVMRGTIHLVTADDALLLRPLVQPVLDGEMARHPDYGPALAGVDLAAVLDVARPLLAERPRAVPELRRLLAERFPEHDPGALAFACRNHLALVQVPPRGIWGRRAQVTTTTAEAWLGRPLADDPSIDDVVPRYLAAFGPATAADLAAWSRLTGFRDVVERLRPQLRTSRDERGRELLDVPDGVLPDPDTPAPARFLPEYDNMLLSHADRQRYTRDDAASLATDERIQGTALSDGFVCATWTIVRSADAATMIVRHLPLTQHPTAELEAEAHRALRFLEPTASHLDVRLTPIR